jgi:protein-tyrosine-phosphatase
MTRRVLTSGLAAFAVACATPATPAPRRILFVCRYGTVKSPVARAMAQSRAAGRGIAIGVAARGLTPEDHMTPSLRAALARDGVALGRGQPQKLAHADIARADIIVAFDPLPPPFDAVAARDWTDTPSLIEDYAEARNTLASRIDVLLDEIVALVADGRRPAERIS